MITKFKTIIASSLLMLGLTAVPMLATSPVSAASPKEEACQGVSSIGGGNACNGGPAANQLGVFIRDIINILLFIVGAVSVIMIIVGGLRYVTSNGDSSQTTAAKNTVLYSVVGLVVAIMAFSIVNFVLGSLGR